MKKLLVVFAIIVSLNLSCEKRMCGCVNPPTLTFNLVVLNATGKDLLNPSTTGSFLKEQIKLYTQEANGTQVPLTFEINKPFRTGNIQTANYQLVSPQLVSFDRSQPNTGYFTKVAYLQFREERPYKLDLSYDQRNHRLNLIANDLDVPKDEKMLPYLNTLFYFSKK